MPLLLLRRSKALLFLLRTAAIAWLASTHLEGVQLAVQSAELAAHDVGGHVGLLHS
jgi:hypothetical protein